MMTAVLRVWWYLVLRGAFSVLFGIMALLFPAPTIMALMLLFGVYALVDGLIAILYGMSVSRHNRVWVLLFEGALSVLAGITAFLWPQLTARLMLFLIAAWAVVTGVLEIAAMTMLRRVGLSGILLAVSGMVSTALGVALFFAPDVGLIVLTGP